MCAICGKCPKTDTFTYTFPQLFLDKLFITMAELADAADFIEIKSLGKLAMQNCTNFGENLIHVASPSHACETPIRKV